MFNLEKIDEVTARNLNPQVLAFVGDGVYSLYIRHRIVISENIKGKELHSQVTNYVKAKGQSDFIERLLPVLMEEELAVYKRARNYKTMSQAKNANIVDYRRATGLEAVIGYLYLCGKIDRLNEILKLSLGENNEN
jgi:ribonuclease-3 family protein